MPNCLDYLKWRGDISFGSAPFNEVDNLLFSQAAYVDFNDIVMGVNADYSISFSDAAGYIREKYSQSELEKKPKIEREWINTFLMMSETKRFGNCHLSRYVNEVSISQESQFAAVKIDMDDGNVFIAYSGTDTSLVGWKENFNMSFLNETPGQKKAVKYLKTVAPHCRGEIRLGGHSKGGNLAVYAAMHADRKLQDRISHIYNNDGPGFTEKMILKAAYQRILEKIHTYVPSSSVVGMLLLHEESVEIISSSNTGILQHDAVSWNVLGDSFIRAGARDASSIKLDRTLKIWIDSMEDSERQKFVDSLFSVLESANIYDVETLGKMTPGGFIDIIKAADGLSDDSKKNLKRTVKLLLDTWLSMQDTNFF